VNEALAAPADERPALYAQAEHILVWDDAVVAPIYYTVTQDLTQPNITRTHSLINREAYEKWDIS
jgi:oligopeptide transport system substrate-binding protein